MMVNMMYVRNIVVYNGDEQSVCSSVIVYKGDGEKGICS